MEALNAAFRIHKRTRSFGERCNWQQYVAAIQIRFESTQSYNQLGLSQASNTCCAIKLRLCIEQKSGLYTTSQHLTCVQSCTLRLSLDPLSPYCVGSLCEIADGGTGLLRHPLSQSQQLSCMCMMRCRITQQDRFALTCQQSISNTLCFFMNVAAVQRLIHPFGLSNSSSHIGQRLHPVLSCNHRSCYGHSPVVHISVDSQNLATTFGCLTDPMCKQRMILTQVRANHQNRLQLLQCGYGHTQPAYTLRRIELGMA